jgi:succinate dehydrogenase flavin-adding protein (antitoxin of CptAB toxin-antitoxin module)
VLKSKLSAGLYLALVFASGILVGGFSHQLYVASKVVAGPPRNPDEWRKRYVNELRDKVKLDDAQVQRLQAILDETRQRFHNLREQQKPLGDAIQAEQINKIRAMLRPEQREAYEQVRAERERKRLEAERKKGPPRP